MRILLIFLLVTCTFAIKAQQQQAFKRCATDELTADLIRQNPAYGRILEQQRLDAERYEQQNAGNRQSQTVIRIPVVFHVVYNTAQQNISDAQIMSQLDILNEDFRRLNADTLQAPAHFRALAGDTRIEFCLASIDPQGNPTTGITRTQTAVNAFSIYADNIKADASGGKNIWNRDQYMNIWVCNLSGGFLGYAQFPGGSASTDGIVLLYTSVGAPPANPFTSAAPYNRGRTGTHEVGHWLGLQHIWGVAGCSNDDGIADTPVQDDENYGCPGVTTSCSNGPYGDMHQNYMDYTNDACMTLFTRGQGTRMTTILNTTRSSLLTSNACGNNNPSLTISGVVRSEDNMPVNTAVLTSTGGTAQSQTTTANGNYTFNFNRGGNYTISAAKTNDVVANNGLTTIDIVHIRRHLLGVQALGSPYKILAADVNADNAVSTLDIAQMRSLILTITTSFNGQQWKFVPASYVFANPANPFPFNSTVSTLALNNLSNSQTVDFIGLKLGDVNNTWDNTLARLQAAGDLHMLLPSRQVQPQDTVLVPVRVKDFTDVSGYQFTMEWDKQVLQFIGVVPAALQGAFGPHQTSNGKLTTTWDHPSGQSMTLADSTVIFQLKFRAVGSAGSVTPLNISSALTKAESYNHQLAPLNLLANTGQVQIGGVTGVAEGLNQGYAFFQNYPNPFSANTTFSFTLPKTEEVSLIIYNSLGQVVATHTAAYGGGEHQLELKSMNLVKNLGSGAYFVSFTAGGFTATKKMVVLN